VRRGFRLPLGSTRRMLASMRALACFALLPTAFAAASAGVSADVHRDWTVTKEKRRVEVRQVPASELGGQLPRGLLVAYARMLDRLRQEQPELWRGLDADGDERHSAEELARVLAAQAPAVVALADRDASLSLDAAELASLASESPADPPRIAAAGGDAVSGGSRAHIFVGRQQAYVADYDVVGNQYDPVISVVGSGTVLDVADPFVTRTVVKP
jgi:hypothetical protein